MTRRFHRIGMIAAVALLALTTPVAHSAFVRAGSPTPRSAVSAHATAIPRQRLPLRREGGIALVSIEELAEPAAQETRTVEVAPRSIGVGPGEKTLVEGRPGVVVVTVGTGSGAVIATQTISPPVPGLVRRVPAEGTPLVALTFDDGPWPGQTEAVLAILQERDVPATFFMIGAQVERRPELAVAVASAGHAIGNHTYSHACLSTGNAEVDAWEIEYANQLIQNVAGVRPTWLRAPGGVLGGHASDVIAQSGMRSALWTVDPQDWVGGTPPDVIAWSVLSAVRPGAVVVLHDGGGDQSATIAALPMIIDGLRAAGYEFVTLDEMPDVKADW